MAGSGRSSAGRLVRVGVDALLWAFVVFAWEFVRDYLALYAFIFSGMAATVAQAWVPALSDSDVPTVLAGQLIVAAPFIVLAALAFSVGLFEGLTRLAPRPFFIGSALGVAMAGVLLPRLVEHQRLAVVIPQAALAGLIIVLAQAVGVLLGRLVTAPNKRFESTPPAHYADAGSE